MTKPDPKSPVVRRRPHTLVFVGLFLAVVVVLTIKARLEPPTNVSLAVSDLAPTVQFAQAQAAGQPMLLFFHSDTCSSCTYMKATIGQVWPAYRQQIELVSINVYDQQNSDLLRTEGIRVVPTLVFIDQTGTRQVEVGTMRPEMLDQRLAGLAAGS
ncbi:thioredoxin family protein [Candidatus Viridilinea mediisalina]|uniref:Thioredoxin domain-containing protein n=1 Tax=Candidatus Viridilinea mediisalina TaxID=2024553 RepID=A0A2A6RP59_9CHLR|nr:thioredoxin family protein [Candidatus Viridilinea mediisalina]PDW04649.1 hypothetical protein CJ255_02410 [Candidatus Viridilinea mediisalina]